MTVHWPSGDPRDIGLRMAGSMILAGEWDEALGVCRLLDALYPNLDAHSAAAQRVADEMHSESEAAKVDESRRREEATDVDPLALEPLSPTPTGIPVVIATLYCTACQSMHEPPVANVVGDVCPKEGLSPYGPLAVGYNPLFLGRHSPPLVRPPLLSDHTKTRYPHSYPGAPGHNPEDPGDCYTSNCAYGCGAWAGPARSGGPEGVDPWGDCPKSPFRDEGD